MDMVRIAVSTMAFFRGRIYADIFNVALTGWSAKLEPVRCAALRSAV
jgi:hypothetical protein